MALKWIEKRKRNYDILRTVRTFKRRRAARWAGRPLLGSILSRAGAIVLTRARFGLVDDLRVMPDHAAALEYVWRTESDEDLGDTALV